MIASLAAGGVLRVALPDGILFRGRREDWTWQGMLKWPMLFEKHSALLSWSVNVLK